MATTMDANSETIDILKGKVTAKLKELDPSSCFDSTLIDYILVMVVNQKSKYDMKHNLALFLKDISDEFVDWLFSYLAELKLRNNNNENNKTNAIINNNTSEEKGETNKDDNNTEEEKLTGKTKRSTSKSEVNSKRKNSGGSSSSGSKKTHSSKNNKESVKRLRRDTKSPSSSSATSSSSVSSSSSSSSRSPPPSSSRKKDHHHQQQYHKSSSRSAKISKKIRPEKVQVEPVMETTKAPSPPTQPVPATAMVTVSKPKRRLKSTIIPTDGMIDGQNEPTTSARRPKRSVDDELSVEELLYADENESEPEEPRPAKKLRPVVEIVEKLDAVKNVNEDVEEDIIDLDAEEKDKLIEEPLEDEPQVSSSPPQSSVETKFYVTLDGVKNMFKGDDLFLMEDEELDPELMNEDELAAARDSEFQTAKRKHAKLEKGLTGGPSIGTGKSERCRYWPACANGERCEYHHPVIKCNLFPFCRFGDKCLYIHPICKFDSLCARKDCPYFHTGGGGGGKHGFRPPVPVMVPAPMPMPPHHQIVCKFFPKCTNPGCEFFHPKNCHFGSACKTFKCPYLHPTEPAMTGQNIPHPSQLKWSSKNNSGPKRTGMVRN